jgi:hypothetical protein
MLAAAGGARGQDASPSPAPSPSASAEPLDPAVLKRAKDWFHRVQAGTIDRTQLSDDLGARLTPDNVAALAKQTGDLGDPTTFDFARAIATDAETTYIFRLTFASGQALSWALTIDTAGKIAKLALRPG